MQGELQGQRPEGPPEPNGRSMRAMASVLPWVVGGDVGRNFMIWARGEFSIGKALVQQWIPMCQGQKPVGHSGHPMFGNYSLRMAMLSHTAC